MCVCGRICVHLSVYLKLRSGNNYNNNNNVTFSDILTHFQDLQQCLFSHCSTCCICVCGAHCQFLLVLLRSFDTYTIHTPSIHTQVKHLRKRAAFIVVSVSSLCNSIAVACLISIELLLSAAHTRTHTQAQQHPRSHTHTHTRACCNAYLTVDLTTFPK